MSGGQARAYELMVVLNPGQAELVSEVITTLKSNIEACDGTISRFEDCKVRTLAYRINKLRQGHYFLFNFTCNNQAALDQLQQNLKTNPHILRSLLIRCRDEISGPSPLAEKDSSEASA